MRNEYPVEATVDPSALNSKLLGGPADFHVATFGATNDAFASALSVPPAASQPIANLLSGFPDPASLLIDAVATDESSGTGGPGLAVTPLDADSGGPETSSPEDEDYLPGLFSANAASSGAALDPSSAQWDSDLLRTLSHLSVPTWQGLGLTEDGITISIPSALNNAPPLEGGMEGDTPFVSFVWVRSSAPAFSTEAVIPTNAPADAGATDSGEGLSLSLEGYEWVGPNPGPITSDLSSWVSGSGTGTSPGTGGTTGAVGGGFHINLLYDAAALAAPASFRAGVQQAMNLLSAAITDNITVNIKIDYSGTGGGAAAGPDNGQFVSYSTVRSDLINNASPGDTSFTALPNASSIQGQSNVAVWNAQLKLWGLLSPNDTTTDDGSAYFSTDISPNLLVGVALHELSHALGRAPYGAQPDVFDFYRFTSAGTRLFSGNSTAPAAYFSLDGGNTKIADYGQTSDPSDFLNSGVQGSKDSFNEFYNSNTLQTLTAIDLKQLDVLGFHIAVPQAIAVVGTSSNAQQGGAAVMLLSAPPAITDGASTTLSSATIKIANSSGSTVAGDELFINGQQSGTVDGGLVTVNWNDGTKLLTLTGNASIAAYQTLLSQVTYQDGGTDNSVGRHPQRTVTWTANDGSTSFSTTSQIGIERPPAVASIVSGVSDLVVAASSLFTASDPDGDGIAIYGFKDNGAGHFLVNGVVQPNNNEIDVTAAQLSQLSYRADSSGADSVQVRVFDGTLWSNWAASMISGPTITVVEDLGATRLSEAANHFYLLDSSGAGPSLNFQNAQVFAGEFGNAWMPLGAEQTASGYEVAWYDPSGHQYSIWNTDSSGNYISGSGAVSEASPALYSAELVLQQDLNGDGKLGASPVTIHTNTNAFGSTSLVEIGNQYYLQNGNGSGPALQFGGAFVVESEFSGWSPLGAAQTSTGYEVAWYNQSAHQYSIWNTNSSGNYVSGSGAVSGSSNAMFSAELALQQDLNGDGHVGSSAVTIHTNTNAFGSTSLVEMGNQYYLQNGGGSGPALRFGSAAVVENEFAGWSPLGAAQTSSGYEMAWYNQSAHQYSIWNTDSSGIYVSASGAVSGTSNAVLSAELALQQDLNEDGNVGSAAATIHTTTNAFGSTSLAEIGNQYYLQNGNGSGPALQFGGAAVVENEFAGWTPLGAAKTASGYEVAWYDQSINQYSIWTTDNNGNYVSASGAVSGTSNAVLSAELAFPQDLNGDGKTGSSEVALGSGSLGETNNAPNNMIVAGPGNSVLTGSTGADTFVFNLNFGNDTVTNYHPGEDVIQFDHTTFSDVASVIAHAADDGHGDAVIAANDHSTVTLQGMTTAVLQQHLSDFHIV